MARNKYPEETIQRILDVSFKLFMEKGYETTSIQDILKELGGLTKGAIYHHFKSKEDILLAVSHRIYSETNAIMQAVVQDHTSLNGLQKLQKLFRIALSQVGQEDMMMMAPKLLDNPTFFSASLTQFYRRSCSSVHKAYLRRRYTRWFHSDGIPGKIGRTSHAPSKHVAESYDFFNHSYISFESLPSVPKASHGTRP